MCLISFVFLIVNERISSTKGKVSAMDRDQSNNRPATGDAAPGTGGGFLMIAELQARSRGAKLG